MFRNVSGFFLLEQFPLGEVPALGIIGKLHPIGSKDCFIDFKANERKFHIIEGRLDFVERQNMLLNMEQKITAGAQAVKILAINNSP